jgi:hypothetical protein
MNKNKIRGPLVTLAAVAALGGGLWLMNVSQETEPAPPSKPVAASTTTVAPSPPPPSTPPRVAFPAKANYVGKIPIRTGVITLEITVNGKEAVAYACDGNTIEAWLKGSATNGALSLASKDKSSRLEGKLQGASPDAKVAGTLWIGEKKWDFTTGPAEPPAGLYVYENSGVRNSWIVDQTGAVTGVQRRADGTTAPAPVLAADGVAVIDGQSVTATRVAGADDVS